MEKEEFTDNSIIPLSLREGYRSDNGISTIRRLNRLLWERYKILEPAYSNAYISLEHPSKNRKDELSGRESLAPDIELYNDGLIIAFSNTIPRKELFRIESRNNEAFESFLLNIPAAPYISEIVSVYSKIFLSNYGLIYFLIVILLLYLSIREYL